MSEQALGWFPSAYMSNNSLLNFPHLKLNITPLALPAGTLDLEYSIPVSILDRVPREEERAVLFDPADGRARRGLNLNLLEAAEATPPHATDRTNQADHLNVNVHMLNSEYIIITVCAHY